MRRGRLGLLAFVRVAYGSGGCATHAQNADLALTEYGSSLQFSVGVVETMS